MTLAERLIEAMKERGVNQNELHRRTGMAQSSINKLVRGESKAIRYSNADKIAEALSINRRWLTDGVGEMDKSTKAEETNEPEAKEETPLTKGMAISVPLYDGLDAEGKFNYANENITLRWNNGYSENSFAIKIQDNAMTPIYKVGDIAVIDPELKPLPGDHVLALLNNRNKMIFMKYVERGLNAAGEIEFELIPENKDYISYSNTKTDIEIQGVCVEHTSYRAKREG